MWTGEGKEQILESMVELELQASHVVSYEGENSCIYILMKVCMSGSTNEAFWVLGYTERMGLDTPIT